MSSVIGRLFGGGAKDYESAKKIAGGDSRRQRRKLAEQADTQPEILYYLAEDSEPEVRRTIAANANTPQQANLVLARDTDDQVRCGLAKKIARLAPQLSADEQEQVGAMVAEILETLARDELPRVRRILAEELKDTDRVPPTVVERLARDEDIQVASPVLEFSPLLNDDVLLQIIESGPIQGGLNVISRRQGVGSKVSDAIIAADDEKAIASLLANPSAQIREETLDSLVDRAEGVTSWHEPMVQRPRLSSRAIRRMSEFVADSLLGNLAQRKDIDEETARVVGDAVRDRIRAEPATAKTGAQLNSADAGETPHQRAEALHHNGKLDDEKILEGLGKGDRTFVSAALTLLAGVRLDVVQKIASMESPKGMISLSWKAGLAMRTAVQLQLRLARIAPGKVMHPKNGFDYPLTEEEMAWQLEFFAG